MVRAGDQVFAGHDDTSLEVASAYLKCASEIERYRALGPRDKVLWYFISESLSLRKAVKEKYGDKVITNVEEEAVHPDCQYHGQSGVCSKHGLSVEDKAVAGLLFGVAQLHAFSRTDYQVRGPHSRFCRRFALLRAKPRAQNRRELMILNPIYQPIHSNSSSTHPLVCRFITLYVWLTFWAPDSCQKFYGTDLPLTGAQGRDPITMALPIPSNLVVKALTNSVRPCDTLLFYEVDFARYSSVYMPALTVCRCLPTRAALGGWGLGFRQLGL